MTQDQLLPNNGKNGSGGATFSVDGDGNITPTTRHGRQTIHRGNPIVTQAATGNTTFSGHVCAQHKDVCQCSTLVDGLSGGSHMAIGTGYTVKSDVPFNSEFELYAVTDSGPVPNARTGDVVIGTT
jgi:uncharacterized Zn-binding protein involved in type VI secretion